MHVCAHRRRCRRRPTLASFIETFTLLRFLNSSDLALKNVMRLRLRDDRRSIAQL
jgi:hypothetical protein